MFMSISILCPNQKVKRQNTVQKDIFVVQVQAFNAESLATKLVLKVCSQVLKISSA